MHERKNTYTGHKHSLEKNRALKRCSYQQIAETLIVKFPETLYVPINEE